MAVTIEQLGELKSRVETLIAAKGDADAKTAESNAADAAAVIATAKAADAKLAEQTADALVASNLNDLNTFIDSLVSAT